MATTVIIPARNEAATIGAIVKTFDEHPETHQRTYVVIDNDTTDDTGAEVWANGGCAFHSNRCGKGQNVAAIHNLLLRNGTLTNRIILCDGDYTGLTTEHISRILQPKRGMAIGVPDFPDIDVPEQVIMAWPHVSGFRCVPWKLIPANAHGYLLETQLNALAIKRRYLISKVMMPGLKSPFEWPLPEKRMQELLRDREWGKENGVLP